MSQDKFYSFIGLIQKSGNLVSGYNNCESEIKKDKCRLVVIAEDASCNTKEKFINMCNTRSLPYFIYGNKENLGFSIGKFPTSVIAIKDVGMSKVVLNMLR